MLGLSLGLQYPNNGVFSPLNFPDLIAWWDAGDISTLYSDLSGTNVTTNGDDVAKIDNKAYTLQGGTTNALGRSLSQSNASQCPHYVSARRAIVFTAADDHVLKGDISTGPVDTSGAFNVFSESTVNLRALTVFFVIDSTTSSLSDPNGILPLKNGIGSASFEINGQSSDNHWIYESTDSAGTADVGNSGVDTTTNQELWTVRLNSTSANSIYRNGDSSDGITNGSSPDQDIIFNNNNNKYFVNLGQVVNSSGSFGGEFYEMLIYNRALSSIEVTEIETNLKAKHNIS